MIKEQFEIREMRTKEQEISIDVDDYGKQNDCRA